MTVGPKPCPHGFVPVAQPVQGPPGATTASSCMIEQILDVVPLLVCSFNPQGEYLFLNRALREYSGLTLPMRQGQGFRAMVHPDDLMNMEPQWVKCFAAKEAYRGAVRLRGSDGRYRWFDLTSSPVREVASQEVAVWYTLALDIDEQREVIDELQLVLDAFPGIIGLWDRQWHNRFANAAHVAYFGRRPEDVRGRHIAEIIGADAYSLDRALFDAAAAGQAQRCERPLPASDGSLRQLSISFVPLLDQGKARSLLTVGLDVTEIHAAAIRLHEAEVRFAQAFEQSPLGFALVSLQGAVTRANPAAARMLGVPLPELVGSPADAFLAGAPLAAAFSALEAGSVPHVEQEVQLGGRDGETTYVRLHVSLVRDRSHHPLEFLVQLEDVTQRRADRLAIERANAELRRSNEELERFAYVASHDLQEPLRTIASYTRLLSERYREHFDERGQRYVDYVVDAAQRMQQLIVGLLEVSRLGRQIQDRAPVALEALVAAVQRLLAKSLVGSRATLKVGTLPVVQGHADSLQRLLLNLLANALKFAPKDRAPVIEIGAETDPRGCTLWVSDNGHGIEPAYRERVFGMFQRLHTREEVPGNGIGLAIVKRVAELHQGKVWIETSAEGGAKFLVWLPA